MAIQQHNTCLVPAEWHLAEHFTQHATKSGELFACSAMTGTLQPNQRELIKVLLQACHAQCMPLCDANHKLVTCDRFAMLLPQKAGWPSSAAELCLQHIDN